MTPCPHCSQGRLVKVGKRWVCTRCPAGMPWGPSVDEKAKAA